MWMKMSQKCAYISSSSCCKLEFSFHSAQPASHSRDMAVSTWRKYMTPVFVTDFQCRFSHLTFNDFDNKVTFFLCKHESAVFSCWLAKQTETKVMNKHYTDLLLCSTIASIHHFPEKRDNCQRNKSQMHFFLPVKMYTCADDSFLLHRIWYRWISICGTIHEYTH